MRKVWLYFDISEFLMLCNLDKVKIKILVPLLRYRSLQVIHPLMNHFKGLVFINYRMVNQASQKEL